MDEHSEHGDVFAERREKLAAWRATGAAYPTQYQPRDEIGSLRAAYERLESGQDTGEVHRVAGRVMARRVHGKVSFVDLKDASGELQLFAQLDALGDERYAALEHVDLGDHRRRRGHGHAHAARRALAARRPRGSCSASRCARCPRSSTA